MNIECLVEGRDICGESPLWHPEQECVYWTDINGFKINRYSPYRRELKSWLFDAPVSTLSLTTASEWLLVAVGPRLILWSPPEDKRVPLAQPERDWPHNRLNDGATDPSGVFWVGSMRNNVGSDGSDLKVEGLTGSLYRVNADGEVSAADSGFGITNTLVWSPDHSTFYCGCSLRNVLYAYDYDAANSLVSNRRVYVENLAPGVPDGSAMDEEGCLWNCRYSGACILRISPAGRVLRISWSTSARRTSVCSIRVPGGVRACSRNWPASTSGKKSWPTRRTSKKEPKETIRKRSSTGARCRNEKSSSPR